METNQEVLIIEVAEGGQKPYSASGKFFIRNGPNAQQMSREEIRTFFQQEGVVFFDEKSCLDFDLDDDFNSDAFNAFLKRANITPMLEKLALLDNLYLLERGHLKNAGVLLFSKTVTRFFLQATITCVLYRGRTKYKILDRKEYNGDLVSNFKNAMIYLESKLNTEFIIQGGLREEKLELPEDALREAILNAVAHRDYFVTGANILIEIFTDRVVITNPGGLVKGLKRQDLGKKSLSRNNLLFGLMQRMGLVEKVGSGIVRMRNEMRSYGLDEPRFEIEDDWFTIIFKRPRDRWSERWSEKTLTERELEIVSLIKRNPKISRREMSEKLGINQSAVQKHIKKLKEKHILKRIGPPRGGFWKIIGDAPG